MQSNTPLLTVKEEPGTVVYCSALARAPRWFPLAALEHPVLQPEPYGILVVVVAETEQGLADALDELEFAGAGVSVHRVVVVCAADRGAVFRILRICEGRADVVQPALPCSYGRAVNAGLGVRRPEDRYALWISAPGQLPAPGTLTHLQQIHHVERWAWSAAGRPEVPVSARYSSPDAAAGEVADLVGPGTLWSLEWLDRLGGLDETLEADAAELDLCLRALRQGAHCGVVETEEWCEEAHRLEFDPAVALPVRCGVVTPALMVGGAERWIISLLQEADTRISWQGVGLSDPQSLNPAVRARIEQTCPVWVGAEAIGELAARCQVLLIWGIPEWQSLLPPDYPGRVMLVSHGSGPWTVRVFTGSEQARMLAGVSRTALAAISFPERGRAVIIPNSVALRRVAPRRSRDEVRAAWGVPLPSRVMGFLGRFSAEKDPLAMARAVRYLPPEWVGVMVGWGYDEAAQHRAAEAIAPGRLRWVGRTTEVGSALAAMDTLLVPSDEEGFSYALAEAWLARVPVVSTPVGIALEQPDLVRGVPKQDHGASIAAAVLADHSDPEGTAARVERAYAFAEEELSPERFGRRWSGAILSAGGANPWGACHRLPGIQVVITGYNVEPWLERCLHSVEGALSGCRWALLFADDGSTDRTWEIANSHPTRAECVRRRRFPKARTVGQAKNRALSLGLRLRQQYPAVLLMDADDVMPRERITHLLRAAVEGGHRLAHGNLRFNDAVPGIPAGTVVPATPDQHHLLNICPPAMVIHASLLPPDGRLFCEELEAMEDSELLCRWELAGVKSTPLPGPVVHEYWPRPGSVMRNGKFIENRLRFYARIEELRSGKRPHGLDYLLPAKRSR